LPQVSAISQYAGGVLWRNSEQITLTKSTLYNNGVAQINIQGQPGGIPISNWETKQDYNLFTQNLTATQNTIVSGAATQTTFSNAYLGGTDWTAFQSTLISNNNTWFASAALPFVVAAPTMGTQDDFPGWQNATGQDLEGSSFTQPSVASLQTTCAVTPDFPDYWFVVDNPAQTISLAGNAVFNVSAVPVGTFNGDVSMTVDGASEVTGLSAGSSQSSISGAAGSAVLTIVAAANTPVGTYPITVIANSGSLTRTAVFSVTVPQTSLRLSAAALNFAGQQINTISTLQSVTLTNIGSASMAITSITASSNYASTTGCGSSLSPGASCSISVTFAPHSVGSITGSITFVDADPSSPQVLSLSGLGTSAPLADTLRHSWGSGPFIWAPAHPRPLR
jgi:Abnormal spindle-like microcephaly-assoc'd, ASPM-SPD-2-Hydin